MILLALKFYPDERKSLKNAIALILLALKFCPDERKSKLSLDVQVFCVEVPGALPRA